MLTYIKSHLAASDGADKPLVVLLRVGHHLGKLKTIPLPAPCDISEEGGVDVALAPGEVHGLYTNTHLERKKERKPVLGRVSNTHSTHA